MTEDSYSILFVDDDTTMLKILQRTFGQIETFHFYTAANSAEAFEKFSNDVDLILLDIHLGDNDFDGLSLAERFRQMKYEGIICMFTGDSSPSLLFHAILAGANDYILKGPKCNIVKELTRLIKLGNDNLDTCYDTSTDPIGNSSYLRTIGLSSNETQLLSDFATYGYPRIKEFAIQLDISETCLWKRLARIRDKLNMDSTSQIAHLLTSISLMDFRSSRNRCSAHGMSNKWPKEHKQDDKKKH